MAGYEIVVRRDRLARFVVLAAALALLTTISIGAALFFSTEAEIGTPSVSTQNFSAEERAYVEFVEPRLKALSIESAGLAALGQARSQDAVALLQGQRRVEALISDITTFTDAYGVPTRFRSSAAEFTRGAREARQSIREARSALARLDWQRLESGVEQCTRAAALFKSAETILDHEATGG
ncbi:MAG TPA: hypothetical protein VGR16_07600 [Thermomicrobiales bacterium]|nr:hypothetical protein [Thermomicrobiales bacterium]